MRHNKHRTTNFLFCCRRSARQAEDARRAAEEATLRAKASAKPPPVRPFVKDAVTDVRQQHVAPLFSEPLRDQVLKEGSRCRMVAR